MIPFSQILGFLGTALVIIAYIPQVSHLIKEHCSAGISLRAFGIWLAASLLLLTHALMIRDLIFITLQIFNLLLTGLICIYASKYRKGACQSHSYHPSSTNSGS